MRHNDDIRKEELLLIALCRLGFTASQLSVIKDLTAQVSDWKYFSVLANDHGVTALVYNNLEVAGLLNMLPVDISTFLKNAYYISLARNSGNMKTMQEVLGTLEGEKIKVVLLKGMALELMVYGNRGLRQMSDADVLTAHKDCMKAYKNLINHGFISLPVKSIFHRLILDYYGKHLPTLIKNGYAVEIHHDLFGSGKQDMTDLLYSTSTIVKIEERTAYVPSPQILFLYLLKHLQRHELSNDSQLRLYTDLVVMIEKYGPEVLDEQLLNLSAKAELNQFLASRLWLMEEYWNVSFPQKIKDFIDKSKHDGTEEKFLFFLKSPKNNPVPDKSVPYRSILRDMPGFHRKILFVMGDLIPTIAFMKKRYNCGSSLKVLFYYPQRLGKLVWLLRR